LGDFCARLRRSAAVVATVAAEVVRKLRREIGSLMVVMLLGIVMQCAIQPKPSRLL
jgi:hypothetical protein